MNVLLINTSERTGGAAIAASRLLRALRHSGVSAQMLVRDKHSDSPHVRQIGGPAMKLRFVGERASIVLHERRFDPLWSIDTGTFGASITRHPAFLTADVIHLHWVNQGMLSLHGLQQILRSGKPVVWTLHDMWPITGVCHHARSCERWKTSCHNCPQLHRPSAHDLSASTFAKKLRVYAEAPIRFVACSEWLGGLAREARLTQGHTVSVIPNAIDTRFYTPAPKQVARREANLPTDLRLILFVSHKATDPNKGIAHLRQAVNRIAARLPDFARQIGVVIVGQEAAEAAEGFPCATFPLGYVQDASRMRMLYRAADVLSMPTLMDNLPNTIVEAQACGLPCVGFRIGGLGQMIKDGRNGFLARYLDDDDLARLMLEVLTQEHRDRFAADARMQAERHYSEHAVAEAYRKLYETSIQVNELKP